VYVLWKEAQRMVTAQFSACTFRVQSGLSESRSLGWER
jgi:hypothetical protein